MNTSSSSLSRLFPSLVLLGGGILLTLPAFWTGNVLGADALSHLVLSRHFIDQLAGGEPYPRWLVGLNGGLGSPVMFFYGPVPYYITSLFRPLVGYDPEGWHQLGFSAALAVIASGFTAYAWLRRLGNPNSALISALVYMAAPYHVIVDLYQRFAFAELWGFVWMPLVLWHVHAIVEGRKGGGLGLAACYALLIMTHLPTTLLFSIVPLLYSLILGRVDGRVLLGAKVAAGMVLGVGLSAAFLFPALLLQSYVQFPVMENGRFYFGNNFLFFGPRFSQEVDEILKYLGSLMASSILVMIGVYALGRRVRTVHQEHLASFWVLVGMAAFFMMLPFSKAIWELLPFLQKVQFPSRFGTVLTVALAASLTLWLGAVGRLLSYANTALLVIISLIGISVAIPIFNEYLTYPGWSRTPSLGWLYKQMEARQLPTRFMIKAVEDNGYTFFLPNEVAPGLSWDLAKSFDTLRSLTSGPEVKVVSENSAPSQLRISHVTPRHLVLMVRNEAPVSLQIRQFYFPGWAATIRGGGMELKVQPTNPSGLIKVDVPAGNHYIDLVLTTGWAERVGLLVSLFSLIVFMAALSRLCYLKK